jgi:hypothetical protein
MNKATKKKVSSSSATIEESIKLLAQATKAIGPVTRLSTQDRRRGLKAKRGGHQVAPMIAAIATKYGISTPDMNGTVINTALAQVQSLAPLVNAAADAHATIVDAHINASRSMWNASTSLYMMLKRAAKSNASIATELKPVEEWFRPRKPAATQDAATTTTTPATAVATTSASAPVVAPAAEVVVPSTVAKAPAPVTPPTTG